MPPRGQKPPQFGVVYFGSGVDDSSPRVSKVPFDEIEQAKAKASIPVFGSNHDNVGNGPRMVGIVDMPPEKIHCIANKYTFCASNGIDAQDSGCFKRMVESIVRVKWDVMVHRNLFPMLEKKRLSFLQTR